MIQPKTKTEREVLNVRYEYINGKINRLKEIKEIVKEQIKEYEYYLSRESEIVLRIWGDKEFEDLDYLKKVRDIEFDLLDRIKRMIIKNG